MKILAFCPFDLETISGNVVTLKRIQRGLAERGHQFEIVSISPSTREIRSHVERVHPDVLHFYHAYKTGRLLLDDFPAVVTVSGTDLNHDFEDPERRAVLERVLRGARRLVTYNRSLYERVRTHLPDASEKMEVIPKGVVLGEAPFDLRAKADFEGGVLFFLPGGIRPVKNNLAALEGLEELAEARLIFAGPILDRAYGEQFVRRLATAPWARHFERIPHPAMGSAYRTADVVLNTSRSEGISNALMEAMAAGRAILASDIPGNRDLIEDGRTGVLYREGEFAEKAARLVRDPQWRESLGRAAQEHAQQNFSVDREIAALLATYERAIGSDRPAASSRHRPTS